MARWRGEIGGDIRRKRRCGAVLGGGALRAGGRGEGVGEGRDSRGIFAGLEEPGGVY